MKRLLLGVGNRLSLDDGLGAVVAKLLSESDWRAVDRGTALENASGIVTREQPDLIIVDAAQMGLPAAFVERLVELLHPGGWNRIPHLAGEGS